MPDTFASDHERDFERERDRLTGLAYRMLGSVTEAEDVVQDSYLRWHDQDAGKIENPGGWLTQAVTRLALDRLKSARRQRERYVGPWLPEPWIDEPEGEEVAENASMALMLALERLSPLERAAFLLRDAFDMGFGEIAVALDRSEESCRQLVHRARGHVRGTRPRYPLPPEESTRIAEAFFVAARSGDVSGLRDLLSESAVLRTDGGGRRNAALRPVEGGQRIARFYGGLSSKGVLQEPLWATRLRVNGLPALATLEADGTLQTTSLEVREGEVVAVYVTRNPDKLRHLAQLVPRALQGQLRMEPPEPGDS